VALTISLLLAGVGAISQVGVINPYGHLASAQLANNLFGRHLFGDSDVRLALLFPVNTADFRINAATIGFLLAGIRTKAGVMARGLKELFAELA